MSSKQEIIKALLEAKRPDLANAVANTALAGQHALLGKDVWGKYAKAHFYSGSMVLEEFPPGGKVRGVQTGVFTLMWNGWGLPDQPEALKAVEQLAKAVKTQQYKQVVEMAKKYAKSIMGVGGYAFTTDERKQKAIKAPNPLAHLNAPKETKNRKGVHITPSPGDKEFRLADTNDKINDPRAFTQGPQAYKKALDSYHDWSELDYHGILQYWMKHGIKFHDYMGMD